MKKTKKMFSILLMVVMFITSAGLLYASIYASGSGNHSTFSSVVFEGETGIRYNNLTKEFEVFNEAGVSWIASGRYVSVDGVVAASGAADPGANYALADGNKTYNIMRDISYTGTGVATTPEVYNTAFDTNKITLLASGILDGRGFYLKDFVVKPLTIDTKIIGTALIKTSAGIIRNLNMSNANITAQAPDSVATAAAIIAGKNTGIIDSCAVYGTTSNNTYQSDKYTGLYGISAINAGRITNCTSNANLTNTATTTAYAAGIASVEEGAVILNNTNNGNISAINAGHAAGIAIDSIGVEFTVRGNVNNGNVDGYNTASSIIDGGQQLVGLTAKGNVNNGNLSGGLSYPYYFGAESDDNVFSPLVTPTYGIRYNADLVDSTGATRQGFEIFNANGISWISSGERFDADGKKDSGSIADANAFYKIAEGVATIDYNDKNSNFNGIFDSTAPSVGATGEFDGNNCKLINFPMRSCGSGGTAQLYYSTLFYENAGIIRNLEIELEIDVNIDNTEDSVYIGGVVGTSKGVGPNKAYIYSVTVSGIMIINSSTGFVGGIVGMQWVEAELVDSEVSLSLSGARAVGGLIGRGGGTTRGCAFRGNIEPSGSFPEYAGGIYGTTFDRTYNYDPIVSGDIAGKYAGWLGGHILENMMAGVDSAVYDPVTEGCMLYDLSGVLVGLKFAGAYGKNPVV